MTDSSQVEGLAHYCKYERVGAAIDVTGTCMTRSTVTVSRLKLSQISNVLS